MEPQIIREEFGRGEAWWIKPVHCVVATLCVGTLMMLTANDPSTDDAVRGTGAGLIGWLMGTFIGKK